MTVIKYSNAVEVSHNSCNNKLNHVDQCEAQEDSNVSTDGALARNNFCHIDDSNSSHDSPVKHVCLLDNISITERRVADVESCASEDKENIKNLKESEQGGEDSDPGM